MLPISRGAFPVAIDVLRSVAVSVPDPESVRGVAGPVIFATATRTGAAVDPFPLCAEEGALPVGLCDGRSITWRYLAFSLFVWKPCCVAIWLMVERSRSYLAPASFCVMPAFRSLIIAWLRFRFASIAPTPFCIAIWLMVERSRSYLAPPLSVPCRLSGR